MHFVQETYSALLRQQYNIDVVVLLNSFNIIVFHDGLLFVISSGGSGRIGGR